MAQYDVDEKDRDRSIIVECEKKQDLPILAKQEQIRQNAIEFTPAQVCFIVTLNSLIYLILLIDSLFI